NVPGTEAPAGIKSETVDENDALTPEQQMRVSQLVENARKDIEAGRLSTPLGNNAYEKYLAVLAMAPGHGTALSGINRIADILLSNAADAVAKGDWGVTEEFLTQAKTVSPEHPRTAEVARALDSARQSRNRELTRLFLAANQAKSNGHNEQAIINLKRILVLDNG